jgi:transposase
MSSTRKNHPASFKAKVVLEALREDVPISILASKHGVHATVIHRWKKEAMASIEAGFSGKHEKISNDQDSHIHELHAKIGQLTVERDFLVRASNRLGLGGVKK